MPNLVGIGNSQVPTNSMLGGLAYQDPAHANLKNVEIENIARIKGQITSTAVDIFVYDTRKDSDGGAWRKRCQHTSWYNESPSAMRGHRKEFPALAIIVLELQQLFIYDGDDPNCSMWMRFDCSTASWSSNATFLSVASGSGNAAKSCTALNAKLIVTGTYGVAIVDFINESQINQGRAAINASNPLRHKKSGDISLRNDTSGQDSLSNLGKDVALTDIIHDCDATVLPNATIDDTTGLPIPTIAVATEHGISIINEEGRVYDMTTTHTTSNYRRIYEVYFTKSNDISFRTNANWVYYYKRPGGDVSDTYWNTLPGFIGRFTDTSRSWASNGLTINVGTNGIEHFIPDRAIGHTNGLELTDITDHTNRHFGVSTLLGYGMRCSISKDFNTGWMHGDIKHAWLADIDDTNITGTELLTNGDFSNGTTGWSAKESGGTFTVSGGQATLASTGTASSWQTTATVVSGKTYTISFDIVSSTSASVQAYYDLGSGAVAISIAGPGAFKATKTFVATSTSVTIWPRIFQSGNMVLDNFSLRESVDDRGRFNEGLQVFGTVPKQHVANGAELVSYGPFSTSNRLRLPYAGNSTYPSHLHIRDRDFHVMFWMNNSGTNSHQTLVGKDNREFSVDILANDTYARRFRIYAQNNSNSIQYFDSANNPTVIGSWNHVCVNFTNGNLCTIYVNGNLNRSGTWSGDGTYDINDATHGVNIGARNTSGSYLHPADGTKLTLVRIAEKAPTAGQVKKIYEDEKHLFQENAKCTLYGDTYKAIIAMAYDDSTDILHAGTAAGRNEFSGLTRINNTTTVMTTAVSASNGLVAEQ